MYRCRLYIYYDGCVSFVLRGKYQGMQAGSGILVISTGCVVEAELGALKGKRRGCGK